MRLILPLLPALCASSPIVEGRATGLMCNRMEVYRANQAAVPTLTGQVIPEPVYTEADYQRVIMDPIARDVARMDPSGLMQPQWMNSRGAIARFDRGSIEIRVMDVQECPKADMAIVGGVVGVLRWLVENARGAEQARRAMPTERLRTILDRTIIDADRATIDDLEYLALLGRPVRPTSALELWGSLFDAAGIKYTSDDSLRPLAAILAAGSLSRRMLARIDCPKGPVERSALRALALELCDCLEQGRMLGESAR